ncbi:MAG: TIM barrel protein, partial [Enterococcus sp.]|nr:TIM barrel protein [Enterococcus sp.]
MAKFDLGVSLYGFTERFINEDDYGYEQMFQDLTGLGIKKFEIVGAQMFEQYPNPKAEEIDEILTLAKKYDVEPFSYGGYVDFAKHCDHDMDDDERINELVFELQTAHRLGCKFLRATGIPDHLYPRAAQMAEFYGVVICQEIHAPEKPSDEHIQKTAKLFDELNSPWLGFVPDFGCYIERPNKIHIERFLKLGANMELLQYI